MRKYSHNKVDILTKLNLKLFLILTNCKQNICASLWLSSDSNET